MSEGSAADFSDAGIDRQFAAIIQGIAADVEPRQIAGRVQNVAPAGDVKPMWYLVPLRMICTITFFMTLSSCIAAYGCVMSDARWGTATMIGLGVSIGSAACRRLAKARYDRRNQ
ncbi:hypothetical protein G3I40_00070 [Streptomyces sp. SID14478]|uniref:hypothetical protein n=1 Tax=Streptomyces sp. SID14478 TaxID=2706073 RepID=UPI0013D98C14|nr:hypothetical protein [Streptomyces sp. SID14478]NEB73649.1 hypothetical protein [Streptomyces sp. SID14478]